jgi:hypothetical protein
VVGHHHVLNNDFLNASFDSNGIDSLLMEIQATPKGMEQVYAKASQPSSIPISSS